MDLDFVNVNVRIKPPPKRKSFKPALKIISTNPPVLLSIEKQITYNFDNIFSEESSQEDIYNKSVKPLVVKVKEGYNCTIFAYGQTGSGKTYTMGTNPEEKNKGIISQALEDFFNCENERIGYDVHISFIEIYNEKVFDLLKNDKKPLSVKGMKVEGLSVEKVFNICEAKHFLELGGKNRHTGETRQNSFSSRSHAIFSIHFTIDDGYKQTSAKLNLVDLAGSEGVKKTGTHGSSFQEGININKGLLCIGQVMTALTANLSYVPYRQSIITTILQDSLNRHNYISLIACVNSDYQDSNESVQTLEFTQRVKKMKSKPEINEILTKFRVKNPELFKKNDRVSCTPVKKCIATPTPLKHQFRKPRGLTDLNNLSVPLSTIFDNSKSSASLSSASNSEMGSNFSPVIRKYMNELENTIIEKLQTVIQNTLKGPTRSSRRLSTVENTKNTPKYSWNQIQLKVSNLVQEEVLQMTNKMSRVTSSPLEHTNLAQAKKILNYNSPCIEEGINKMFVIPPEKIFRKSTPCVSPIDSFSPKSSDTVFKKPTVPAKKIIEMFFVSPNDSIVIRRSARLSVRRTSILNKSEVQTDIEKSIVSSNENIAQRRSNRNSVKHPIISDEYLSLNTRRTIRKSRRITNIKIATPIKYEQKNVNKSPKTKLKVNSNGNTKRNRAVEVLEILNTGDKKQLQILSTIGPKTAERILIFRHYKGSFSAVTELSEMPGWSNTLYRKFIEQNFLSVVQADSI